MVTDKDAITSVRERSTQYVRRGCPERQCPGAAPPAPWALALACVGRPLAASLLQELEIGLPVFVTEDAREGRRAFEEKRKPSCEGR